MPKKENLKIIILTAFVLVGMILILFLRTWSLNKSDSDKNGAAVPTDRKTELSGWINDDPLPPGFNIAKSAMFWMAGTEAGYGTDAVLWIINEDTGIYHLFLPPSANLTNIKVWHKFSDLTLDDKVIISGEKTDIFAQGGRFTLRSGEDIYPIEITQSENVGAMFLVTDMPLRWLHENKDNRSPGMALVVNADGEIEYSNVLERINGRGNTSWGHRKKPYNIKFPKAASLFGMTDARKYSLIANAQDETMIRHKISYDLAGAIGLPYSPKSFFVELYVRGEYLGVYQLTEKIEIGKNYLINDIGDLEKRTADLNEGSLDAHPFNLGSYKGFDKLIDPEDITGPYLLEGYHKPDDLSVFRTYGEGNAEAGVISINSPQYATKAQVEYIRDFFNEMEEAVYSATGRNAKGRHFTEYLNIESAAKMFLIQEYTKNLDGGNSSFYFWKAADSDGDGKLHFGPVWDFDNTFGNGSRSWNNLNMDLSDPEGWWMTESTQRYGQNTIFGKLVQHEEFLMAVHNCWPEFADAVEILLGIKPSDEGLHSLKSLNEYEEMLNSSVDMNFKIVEKIIFETEGKGDEFLGSRRSGPYSAGIEYLRWFAEERYVFITNEYARKLDELN